ncbi:MAG TPA: VOC family protein [Longimicrobiaceae bacterium]
MSNPPPTPVQSDRLHPVLTVPEIRAAIDYYTSVLGFEEEFTWGEPPTFGGVRLDEIVLFFQLGVPQPAGLAVAIVVDDADGLHAMQASRGARIIEPPGDRDYGIRDYLVEDLNGYRLSFGHSIYHVGDPVEIERVDVPVRLEKRLAALLEDLAVHKRMTLSECLEEILLHTCEPYGDGVASPHTRVTLAYIQELKRKHGIDYDTHASYRFVEKPAS